MVDAGGADRLWRNLLRNRHMNGGGGRGRRVPRQPRASRSAQAFDGLADLFAARLGGGEAVALLFDHFFRGLGDKLLVAELLVDLG
jgi:hypothetical protein